ncbi:cell division control protein 6 [Halalkaliarchaeum desulfuricum]|uniref:ORC1-type DNA replication protein n=1 Tax=Halalkaliarchaeum desulfuricum TaxID=2055893 RepID=A0A343TN77_9EURY|nr:AAA family ATPase [Halalkaliarchaeum desulfuricum]AUX10549.1 cell division control protein 6 [Halalkaliarchaeum desulfuricum]
MPEYFQDRSSIFADESVLVEEYTPDELPEREAELTELGAALSPGLGTGRPHDVFLQGKTGQGKTAAARFILDEFEAEAADKDVDLTTIFHTCAGQTSSYQVVCNLVEQQTGENPNGHPKRTVFDHFYDLLNDIGGTIVLVLDEVDAIGQNDLLLYELSRAKDNDHIADDVDVSVIGISNDGNFLAELSPKVKDSFRERRVMFDAYDAEQLRSILERRVEKAFVDDAVDESAIALCAGYAANDQGSARQAIDYLYEAGEIALRQGDTRVTDEHAEQAEAKVDRRSVMRSIEELTLQDHLALVALVVLEAHGETPARTRRVYATYRNVCAEIDANDISLDRVRDHLKELDLLGVTQYTTRTAGSEGGRKYFWELNTDLGATIEVLDSIDRLDGVMHLVR